MKLRDFAIRPTEGANCTNRPSSEEEDAEAILNRPSRSIFERTGKQVLDGAGGLGIVLGGPSKDYENLMPEAAGWFRGSYQCQSGPSWAHVPLFDKAHRAA